MTSPNRLRLFGTGSSLKPVVTSLRTAGDWYGPVSTSSGPRFSKFLEIKDQFGPWFKPRRVKDWDWTGPLSTNSTLHPRIHPQQLKACWKAEDTVWTDVWRLPCGSSLLLRKHKIPNDQRQDENTDQELRGSIGCPWTSLHMYDGTLENYLHSIQEGWPGLVRFEKFEDNVSQKDGSKVRRAICDNRSHRTSNVPIETPSNMEDPWCVSCCIASTVQGEWGLQGKLSKAPTWISWWRRDIWGRKYS